MYTCVCGVVALTDLHGCFWKVVWVSQFSGHVETEVLRILDGAVSEFDADAPSLFECLFQQQRFKNRVNFLSNVLQEDRCSELDAVLQCAHKVTVCEFDDVEVV